MPRRARQHSMAQAAMFRIAMFEIDREYESADL